MGSVLDKEKVQKSLKKFLRTEFFLSKFHNTQVILSKKRNFFILLILLVLVTRVPFLNLGFGLDGDAWLVSNSAFSIANSNLYQASRGTGYPLFEMLSSLFIKFGPIGTNGLVMFFSIGSYLCFFQLCNSFNMKYPKTLTLAYVFFPYSWINSVNTMDYMVASFFILLTLILIFKGKTTVGGITFGLAIASRPSVGVFLFPLIYLIWKKMESKRFLFFLIAFIFVSAIMFLPVIFRYGLTRLLQPTTVSATNRFLRFGFLGMRFFGILAIAITLLYVGLNFSKIKNNIINMYTKKQTQFFTLLFFSLTGVLLFLYLPNQPSYLLPVFPFILIIGCKILKNKKIIYLLAIVLILTSMVNVNILNVTYNDREISPSISQGIVIETIKYRKNQIDNLNKLYNFNKTDCVILFSVTEAPIMSSYYQAKSDVKLEKAKYHRWNYKNSSKNIIYAAYLKKSEVEHYQEEGYKIYYTQFAEHLNQIYDGYRVSELNNTEELETKEVKYPFLD